MKITRAAILSVGSELLTCGRIDGNADWLIGRLDRLGIRVRMVCRIGDDEIDIERMIGLAHERCPLVILTGGLGPTEDDRTRPAIARALDLEMEKDPAVVAALRERFARFGRTFRPEQEKQAEKPAGADWIVNPLGTAPGILLEHEDKMLAALPGVPAEMQRMFREGLEPKLANRADIHLASATLKIAGRIEPDVDRTIRDLYDRPEMTVTILSGLTGIEIRVTAAGDSDEEALERKNRIEAEIGARFGDDLYGRDDETLASVVGQMLVDAGSTVAAAESCTAGLLAGTITAVPGSSAWFRGGLVAYQDDLKQSLAGVSRESLERHGAVSTQVASELARGVRERCRSTLGLGITGIAGPTGGSPDKPVGLVHLALCDGEGTTVRELRLPGNREQVRGRTVTAALDLVRRHLLSGRRS